MKEQEIEGIKEAVEQVLKPTSATPEPPAESLLSVTPANVNGKPV